MGSNNGTAGNNPYISRVASRSLRTSILERVIEEESVKQTLENSKSQQSAEGLGGGK